MLLAMAHKDKAGTMLVPTQHLMIMIKNVCFCVTKAKIDDPTRCFDIILLGTD